MLQLEHLAPVGRRWGHTGLAQLDGRHGVAAARHLRAAIVPGTYHFTVEAWDLDTVNPPSVPVTLTVSAPAVDTSTLPGATGPHLSCNRYGCWKQPGIPYQAQLSASGGLSPYWWTLTSGALPPGLSLSPGGAITGTPTADGTWTFTVEVVDQNGIAAQKTLALTVG